MEMTLVTFDSKGERKEIPINNGVSIIGRRPDCDLQVAKGLISRKHCRIVRRDDGFYVQDLGSTNGTFVNQERVMEASIKAGDRLSLANVSFTVRIDGKPRDIPAPQRPTEKGTIHGPDDTTITKSSGESQTLTGTISKHDSNTLPEGLVDDDPDPDDSAL